MFRVSNSIAAVQKTADSQGTALYSVFLFYSTVFFVTGLTQFIWLTRLLCSAGHERSGFGWIAGVKVWLFPPG